MQRGTPVWEAAGFLAMSKKMLREVYDTIILIFRKRRQRISAAAKTSMTAVRGTSA